MAARLVRRSMSYQRDALYAYTPPDWAKTLHHIPPHRLILAQLPTPIHPWSVPGLPSEFELYIKRDDLTGAALSGNKIRKLEFLMAEALINKCDAVITAGGIQSNHARATAVIGRQLQMEPHLLLRSHNMDPSSIGCKGNLLLDRLMGSHIILCPYRSKHDVVVEGTTIKGVDSMMEEYAQVLRSKGHNPYSIPIGGSNVLGLWGYIEAFKELMDQNVLENFDDIIMAVGSGGTVAGIAIANYLTGSKLKVHAVCVCDDAEYFYNFIDDHLGKFGLSSISAKDIVDLIDGYKGRGYALSTDDELSQLVQISSTTGIILDRVYTLKAVRGMLEELKINSGRFKGKKILFLHTGGIHSIFDGELEAVVASETADKLLLRN